LIFSEHKICEQPRTTVGASLLAKAVVQSLLIRLKRRLTKNHPGLTWRCERRSFVPARAMSRDGWVSVPVDFKIH
jgi:hypothetical protein